MRSYNKDGATCIHKVSDLMYALTPTVARALTRLAMARLRGGTPMGTWSVPLIPARRRRRLGPGGTMVRKVLDDAARTRLVDNIVGHLLTA
jgi:catalase